MPRPSTPLENLRLPKRYEALEREAQEREADLTRIVQRVDAAAERVETLLRQVRDGGLERFELFLGASGSGKTTFFKTLKNFFDGMTVEGIPSELNLEDIADHIRERNLYRSMRQVWVLYDRDNPNITDEQAYQFFESLRVLFREERGRVVIVWPITDKSKASMLSEQAWAVGRDSVVDLNKGLYAFKGMPREDFGEVAELTVRSLRGQSLEVFGLTSDKINPLSARSATISEFFSMLEAKSVEINGFYQDLLKQRIIPSVWILVGGDISKDLNLTVATLTQGTQKTVDIDRVVKYLEDPSLDALYLKEWKDRRNEIAFLLRMLDVRIFEMPPNVALAAVRAYGDDEIKKHLKLASVPRSVVAQALENASFFRAIKGEDYGRSAYLRATDQQTADEYRRIQARAARDDKRINKAIALAIESSLDSPLIQVEVKAEIRADQGNLRPDIQIKFADGRVICLEPTWRSTGAGIENDISARQNTLTVGHIQKYLLEKILGYVHDLGL
jgi:hypothetical protein